MQRATLLALLLTGCPPSGPAVTEIVDDGTFCIGEFGDYSVDFDVCLSSSCDTLVAAECTGELNADGTVLTLTSYARIESEGETCSADCGQVIAVCSLPTISSTDGLTVVFGDQELSFRNLGGCP